MTQSVILVTGATGAIGIEVCAALASSPRFRVRAALHSPSKKSLLPEDVDTVPFDFQDEGSVDEALEGVDKLFLLAPGGPTGPPFTRAVVERLARHSVRQIVKQSSYAPSTEPQAPTDLWALETEAMVEQTGIPWTFLRPPWCNQNFTRGYFAPMVASGVLALPFGDGKAGWIDTRDVGEVARVIFEEGETHHGEAYTLTGPEVVSLHDIAGCLSRAAGEEIVYRPLSDQEWIEACLATGQPMEAARSTLALISKTRDGLANEVTDVVERLTGSPPCSFETWAQDNSDQVKALREAGRSRNM